MKRGGKAWVILRAIGALLAIAFGLLIWSVFIEPDRLVVKQVDLPLPGWRADTGVLKLVAVSDLHVGSPHVDAKKLDRVVAEINAQEPDVIVLLGDFVVGGVVGGKYVEPEPIAEKLKNLKAKDGVFAILGNHDWWRDGTRVRHALENVGIRVLENDAIRIRAGAQAYWLVGVADLWTRTPDIRGSLAKVTDNAPVILLTHNPDIFPDVPPRVALTLAGHTHGGQVNLPLFGRLVVPSNYGSRYAIGHVVENARHLYVTPGIGTSILPLRFRVPPEITVLTIHT